MAHVKDVRDALTKVLCKAYMFTVGSSPSPWLAAMAWLRAALCSEQSNMQDRAQNSIIETAAQH